MFKRAFYAMIGLGAGVTLGIWAVRKVEHAQQRYTPDQVAGRAVGRASSVRDRLVLAVEEGRVAAAAKETELRAVYRGRHSNEPHA